MKREIHSYFDLLSVSVDMINKNRNIPEMLGQLIMPRLEIGMYETDVNYRSFINDLIAKKMVVGFCVFGGSIDTLPVILEELQRISKKNLLPELFMSCDCEWGLPMRLHSGGTEFPHLMALEQMNDQKGIKKVARAIGTEMSALGLHWNFAPVADINSNPKNPIINIRSFSGDPNKVAESAQSFSMGLEDAGIISTAKHFPGHGDTHIDSHRDLPSIDKSAEEFDLLELIPFRYLSERGIPTMMTGHIAAPKLAESLGANEAEKILPATISSYLTRKLLRERIGFEGVIVTDSLEMYGLQKVINDPGEIAVRAFAAGADILLMPTDPVAAYNGLVSALAGDRISFQSIEESISRIDKLRSKYIVNKPVNIKVQWLDHKEIAREAARNSIALSGSVPKPFLPSSVIILATGSEKEKTQRDDLSHFFLSEFPGLNVHLLFNSSAAGEIDIGNKPLIITLHRPRGILTEENGRGSIHELAKEIIDTLCRKNIHPIGLISFGDPYITGEFSITKPDFTIKTFSDSNPSIQMVVQLLKNNI